MRRHAAVLLLVACGRDHARDRAPASDAPMLAARQVVAAQLRQLFDAGRGFYADDPDGGGYPTRASWVMAAPDLRPFATAAAVDLPAATPRLARCRDATVVALAAFRKLAGPFLGEGSMAGRGLSPDQQHAEVTRQVAETVGAYCLWRAATRICRAEATASGAAVPDAFEPRFLSCTDAPAPP